MEDEKKVEDEGRGGVKTKATIKYEVNMWMTFNQSFS